MAEMFLVFLLSRSRGVEVDEKGLEARVKGLPGSWRCLLRLAKVAEAKLLALVLVLGHDVRLTCRRMMAVEKDAVQATGDKLGMSSRSKGFDG